MFSKSRFAAKALGLYTIATPWNSLPIDQSIPSISDLPFPFPCYVPLPVLMLFSLFDLSLSETPIA